MSDTLLERFRESYWAAQIPWMEYRRRTGDRTDGLKLCGTAEKDAIASLWRDYFAVSREWKKENPSPGSGCGLGCDRNGYPEWTKRGGAA